MLNGFLDTKGEKVKEDGGGEINLKSMTDRNAVRAEASMVTSIFFSKRRIVSLNFFLTTN